MLPVNVNLFAVGILLLIPELVVEKVFVKHQANVSVMVDSLEAVVVTLSPLVILDIN